MDRELIYNPWFIAAISFLASALVGPVFFKLVDRIRGIFGVFSGQYLAFTFNEELKTILLEDVRCRHRGRKISGKIYGVSYLAHNPSTNAFHEQLENTGKYRFDGWIAERQFVISYRSILKTVHSVGSITLMSDDIGQINFGQWAGSVGKEIASAPCLWIRQRPTISSRTGRKEFVAVALRFVNDAYKSTESAKSGKDFGSTNPQLSKTLYMEEWFMFQGIFDALVSKDYDKPKTTRKRD